MTDGESFAQEVMTMNVCLLFLALLLSFQSNVYAEQLTGPADLQDKPDGKIVVSLNKDADVDCIALKDDWYIVSLDVFLAKTDLPDQNKINKKTVLYDAKNREIGKTMDVVAIDRMNGIREGKDRSSTKVVAYLNKKYIKNPANKPLIIEEYKLPAKNIHDLQRKNKCSDLADCLPADILKKRTGGRTIASTFRQDQMNNSTLTIGRVTLSKAKNIRKDLDVPALTYEIQAGERPLYSFESLEDTFYREIQHLYAYNGHWILEYKQKDVADKQCAVFSGTVLMDGVNLTAQYKVQEMFEYGYINDKPFYFFRSGSINGGISYGGVVLPVEYDEIQHYLCCADSGFNVRVYKDMVGFFATRNGALYYVEAGIYQ